jgi:iron complex transport system ATP-binding protein
MLEAQDLAIGYGARIVAADISLGVGAGEVLCILGPNGAGKTTLFRTLLGLIPPLAGAVRIEGRAAASLARREIARAIAYVPQAQTTEFAYTVMDLVLMGRTSHLGLFAAPTRADRARAEAALDALGIAHLAGADANRISGGQRQLTLVARALAQDARTIVMDEPTASLDFGNRLVVLDQIRRLTGRGLAVVLSTHDPDQALELATRVAVIAEGGLFAYGLPAEVVTGEVLSRIYAAPVTVERTESGRRVVRAAPDPGQ